MENNDTIGHRISDGPRTERAPRRRIFCGTVRRGRSATKAFFKRVSDVFVAELKANATPRKAAGSFAFGIFLGFFPIYGFQTVVAIFAAKLLKLNAPIAVLGTLAPFPFIIPIVFASLWLGSVIFASPEGTGEMQTLMALFSESKPAFFAEVGKLFVTGGTIISILAGGLAYVIAYPVCKMVQRKGKMP
ncbi:MAG: DUF2062 domain-containing protein [Chitinispirillia bacterium]|nr:DUF2062 domain-containing protein [Chitinispirillia bacterium]